MNKSKKCQKIIYVAPEKSSKINKGNPKFISDSKSSVLRVAFKIAMLSLDERSVKARNFFVLSYNWMYDGAMEGN